MKTLVRSWVVTVVLVLCCAAPALADHTQQLDVSAQLVRQQVGGKPWIVDLTLGARLGTTDGSVPSPVRRIVLRFTRGARVHPEAFGTCTLRVLRDRGTAGCPERSRLGRGTATVAALQQTFPATIDVFNGPAVRGGGSRLLLYARALSTVVVELQGTLRRTSSGKYGYLLDLPVERIRTVGENDASIVAFSVTVGGIGRRGVPFIEAPTACDGGWPFSGTFTYADGATGASSAVISCLLKATNN